MLIENSILGQQFHSSIIGIGLNLNQTLFTSKAPNPVSLRQITGKEYDKEEILESLLRRFYILFQEKEENIRIAYKKALYRGGGDFFTYSDSNGLFEAYIKDVEPTGHLLLQLRNGETRRYAFNEVVYTF
jgi:BirA family biotin operon repressor/biotin-[acetyl-CoA-carboxylase] ligase